MTVLICDTCKSEFPVKWADIPKYKKIKCPNCGKKDFVSKIDLIVWNIINFFMKKGWVRELEENEEWVLKVSVNTSNLNKLKGGQ